MPKVRWGAEVRTELRFEAQPLPSWVLAMGQQLWYGHASGGHTVAAFKQISVFQWPARAIGNRTKPHGHALVVKPAEWAFCC